MICIHQMPGDDCIHCLRKALVDALDLVRSVRADIAAAKKEVKAAQEYMAMLVPAWKKCLCCDDYVCTIHHGLHVYDCTCPSLDDWLTDGLCPYMPCVPRVLLCQGYEDGQ